MTMGTTGALEANLARTAVDVVIPPEHAALLEIAEPWRGVQDATLALLREIHHRYPNWAQTLADLHRRAMNDFHYYDGCPRGADAIRIVCDLYATIVRDATPDDVRDDAARQWLTYLELVVRDSGDTLPRNLAAVHDAVRALDGLMAAAPRLAPVTSPALRRLGRTLTAVESQEAAATTEATLRLLAQTLGTVLTSWLERDDPAGWERDLAVHLLAGTGAVTHMELRSALATLHALTPPLLASAGAILAIPDNAQIVRSYLTASDALAGAPGPAARMTQIRWLLRVLGHPDLATAHETALREITRATAALMADDTADRRDVLDAIFELLHDHAFPYPHTVLQLIARIGSEALRSGDPDLAEALVDDVLGTDFEYPAFAGFTDEWALRANPAHVEAIRTYLRLVEANPVAARPLLAALVAHLRLGGVSIPDSALFQRDVSALLAAPIEPVYVEVTHLLRLLPVFFAEIGSEGRLRDVSTRIDEALQRRDPLCHFLRKQSHVECNAHLIDFVEEVGRFWATGDPAPLSDYVPPSLFVTLDPERPESRGIHLVFEELVRRAGSLAAIFASDEDKLHATLAALDIGDATDRERAELLVQMWHEIRRKYALDHGDIVDRLREYRRVDSAAIGALDDALARGDSGTALDMALAILEELQAIVLHPGEIHAVEDIYFKRHIAVGIPSMYGSYREERLDAAGLTFRLESLAGALCEQLMREDALPADPRGRLRVLAGWLHQLHRGLRVEGFRAQGLAHTLAMLDEGLAKPDTTDAQLVTVFQQLGHNLEVTIRARILDAYEEPVRRVVMGMIDQGLLPSHDDTADEAVLRYSEALLRDLIAGSFALGRLDALIGIAIRELDERVHAHGAPAPPTAITPNLRRSVLAIETAPADLGIVALGGKAFMLRQLHQLGLNVPAAFVLTTDVFRARAAIRSDAGLRQRLEQRVRTELRRLEHSTGARFGDPRRPLLLSVRGGAPLSMPGMLATFLNVGMNPVIAEGVATLRGDWAAWDSYRRFVQSWGMAHGLARDGFDQLIAAAKTRLGVAHKAHLPAEAMRALAMEYRDVVTSHGIRVEDDPFAQLITCIDLVHDSWDAEASRLYRRELHISDEWGTAAIVQAMVFGNLDQQSGSGVILTDQPERSSDVISLTGDFAIQSQGDDVVGGLVEAHPITERQRRREARTTERSLEKDFPALYRTLERIARTLVQDHGMNHQEIEFTFESDGPEDLYLLQTRDTVVATRGEVPAFVPSPELDRARAAHGIGVSGGALSGRVACTLTDIAAVRDRHPGEAVILLRPDTVPDDIALVLAADGVLTALGGATSHAAVAAKRLGKTCVVGCRALDVDEQAGRASLAGRALHAGDPLSISGLDGTVYLDVHPVAMVGVEGGHRW